MSAEVIWLLLIILGVVAGAAFMYGDSHGRCRAFEQALRHFDQTIGPNGCEHEQRYRTLIASERERWEVH